MNVRSIAVFLITVTVLACNLSKNSGTSHFQGTNDAVSLAESMFDTLGGLSTWAKTKALYIKATHEEKGLKYPYISEIWRDLDTFKLRIEQKSPEFHRIGLFSHEGGWIIYEDQDSTRQLTNEQLKTWQNENDNNIYVMLHRIALTKGCTVRLEDKRLTFLSDTTFLFAVRLDEGHRPYEYITHSNEGKERITAFTAWERHPYQGQLHPVSGGPKNEEFIYTTEIWQPHRVSYDRAFNIPASK